jgi:tetratricopeptide (TPR) repeat protein
LAILVNILIKKLTYLILIGLIVWGCTTDKNAFLNRNYHYLTVKYNGFFNGNEAYKLAKNNIADNHEDDFDEILDVFQFGDEIVNKSEYPNLNRAIIKAAKMVDNHSMKFKIKGEEVEVNSMIDDSYLLVGKARFLKFDLISASETFLYIKKTYKEGIERYKASLWLALTFIYQENYVDAETLIKAIKEDKEFPKKFKDELVLYEAIAFKRSGQAEKAIIALEQAASLIKKRKLKRRIQFILAQMYQQKGDLKKASELYELIGKKATNYDLQFNAKINLAITHDGNGNEVISLLEKMLKDEKNKEYKDQIYYALAKVYERKGDEVNTISNYKKSAASSLKNQKQKGKAYLALGDYYFEQPDYLLASNYYDSCLIALPRTHSSYTEIYEKNLSLEELVKHIKIVKNQDSLLKVANMSNEERVDFINAKIESAKVDADEKAGLLETQKEEALANIAIQGSNGSNWIFDNPLLLIAGLADFKGLWGGRKLEDNWRRSDKTSLTFEASAEEVTVYENIPENQTVDFYLKDLPLGVDQKAIANDKIQKSYYQLGILYRDNFSDLEQSNFYFNKLINRYPKNLKEAISLYQLYRNYDKLKLYDRQGIVKNKILSDHAGSEYAKLLLNPGMLAEQEKNDQANEVKYGQLFTLYKSEKYETVINEVRLYKPNLTGGELAGRFDLLEAFALGNVFGKDSLEANLKKAYQKNMGTEVAAEIDLILGGLRREHQKKVKSKMDSLSKEKQFKASKSEPHYFVLIFNNKINKESELLNGLSDFNTNFFKNKALKVKVLAWNEDESILVVKPFKTEEEYSKYYLTVRDEFLKGKKETGDLFFTISKTNYTKFFKHKDVVGYVDFFKRNYIK